MLDHPDCITDRECELYDALMGLASHATAYHRDYRRWTQGGVTLEPIVSKALRLGAYALPSTDRPSPASKLEAYRKALEDSLERLANISAGRCPAPPGTANDPAAFREWAAGYADIGYSVVRKALAAGG